MTTLALLTVRTSVVLLAALAAHAACRRQSAALRHSMLAAGVGAALLVVPLTVVLPSWGILPNPAAAWSSRAPGGQPSTAEDLPAAMPAGMAAAPIVPSTVPAATGVAAATVERAALGVWLLGTLIGAGLLLTSLVRLARLTGQVLTEARQSK